MIFKWINRSKIQFGWCNQQASNKRYSSSGGVAQIGLGVCFSPPEKKL